MMNNVTFRRAEYVINEMFSSDSFSDMDVMMQDVAEDTGYDLQFLWECVYEGLDDDHTADEFFEALETVVFTAYEQDY